MELFVRDLARCTAFYRDTLGLEISDSDADSARFKIGDVHFFVVTASAAADLISQGALE